MAQITIYITDSFGIYVGSQEIDDHGRMPPGSVLTKPPKHTGSEVAHWSPGEGWEVLADRPPAPEPPPPPRRLLPKSVVQERAHTLNKLATILAVLRSAGQEINYARWFAPDWPKVFADDPGVLEILAYVGCTEAEIAEITAIEN